MHSNRHLSHARSMGLAQLRLDGFCSLRAFRFPGHVITKPLHWPGGKLQVNANMLGGSGEGSLSAEVLAEDLVPVSGLSVSESNKLNIESLMYQGGYADITWSDNPKAIEKVRGQTIRLKFYVENYDFYGFRASTEVER